MYMYTKNNYLTQSNILDQNILVRETSCNSTLVKKYSSSRKKQSFLMTSS